MDETRLPEAADGDMLGAAVAGLDPVNEGIFHKGLEGESRNGRNQQGVGNIHGKADPPGKTQALDLDVRLNIVQFLAQTYIVDVTFGGVPEIFA
ncbi:hypothetical protein D3C75_547450 [compost metagenome]